ncbi:PREDICTED: uncharacterized protein LOC105366627 [Ceratosolen solmsi marchali]|uniref:Uncharacterized protein LOC105366627 n=1 Tax=Ceratosolen solmsi marchali TaxID=326594 RepID=A0AAJ7E0R2_9HYME|nr:PREDICTED: uncharacterized protein LOC105366627 [Ceratosolen solmsi marchali]
MLKWTVSRSLSAASSTPHGPDKAARRPFRDLSNTPPATSGSSRSASSSCHVTTNGNVPASEAATSAGTGSRRPVIKRTPSRRRRCRSHGSDLRGYFQVSAPATTMSTTAHEIQQPGLTGLMNLDDSVLGTTKPSARSAKRQSGSPHLESFYQSTPRVDADIGPLTLVGRRQLGQTLPTDPQALLLIGATELPRSLIGDARTAKLQSHVSDFFHQISLATSPEDVMESEALPLTHGYSRRSTNACLSKLTRFAKLQARCKTPHNVKAKSLEAVGAGVPFGQTPLAGKLLDLRLDQNSPKCHGMDNHVAETLDREQEVNYGARSVAEILLKDSEERQKILESKLEAAAQSHTVDLDKASEEVNKLGATLPESLDEDLEEAKALHNDSSVSSASQLLENPSPVSWAFCSPSSDLDSEFTLKRQRAIRRKRQANNGEPNGPVNGSKRMKRDKLPFIEAVNRHVKRLALETDLDISAADAKSKGEPMIENLENIVESVPDVEDIPQVEAIPMIESLPQIIGLPEVDATKMTFANAGQLNYSDTMTCEQRPFLESLACRKRKELTLSGAWDTDSPKSSLIDSFTTTNTSTACTPEAPLVATVRRCLKYSPETPGAECSRSGYLLPANRGSIEIECSALNDHIHVKIIKCKDLRRAYEGPIHAYVKASIKDPRSGEGCVKRTAVHRATPNPIFQETLVLPCLPASNDNCAARQISLDIAVWHRDRRARRSELLGCMTLPLPLSQDKEASWHPLDAGSGRNTSAAQEVGAGGRGSVASPPLSKDTGDEAPDNNNSAGGDELAYLRHLELEPLDPLTGLPLHPGFTARGGRTPCTVTRRLARPAANANQVPWGFSLSWGRPPRVERVDPVSPAERSGLRPGDYVVFVESTNVVTQPREDVLELIQAATCQLVLEVYRRSGQGQNPGTGAVAAPSLRRPSSINSTSLQSSQHRAIAFTAEAFPNLAVDATPEEELIVREARYWACMRSGQKRFSGPLGERRDVLSATDHMILFQNLDELIKLSEEVREEGGIPESYLNRIPRIIAAYRRYFSGLQRACCLLVALRKNAAFAKIVCEPAVPRRRRPDLTGLLLQPLEHYREMTRLLSQACPRNCQGVRDLAHGYREATANAAVMEPPRDNGRPLLSLQEVESRLVFARCKPFALAIPGRQWLFGGALAKVEGRARVQATWALLLSDLLVFARVSRDRVLFVTEEPLRLACIAEACFTVRKHPTEFRLQVTTQPSAQTGNSVGSTTELVQCTGIVGGGGGGSGSGSGSGGGGGGGGGGGSSGGGVGGGCSPHSRPRRRVLILRAPSPELKAVWHNLLQRQIIYVNTISGNGEDAIPGIDSPDDEESPTILTNHLGKRDAQHEIVDSPEVRLSLLVHSSSRLLDEYFAIYALTAQHCRSTQQLQVDKGRSGESLDSMLERSNQQQDNHLAQWVRNSHQIPPPDHEVPIEEWTPEELAARTPKETAACNVSEVVEENTLVTSDVEQHSTASSASLSTVKSNSLTQKKNGSIVSSKDTASSSMNICRKCHRSGCPTPLSPPPPPPPPPPLPPSLVRDPFAPLPPKIAVLPPTPDLCSKHRPRNSLYDSPSRCFSADGNTEDGSEDDLECDVDPPYRALRRFGTMSSLDQDDELDEQTVAEEETGHEVESPPASGLRAWTLRAGSYVVSKMSILEHFGEGCLLQPPAPPERTESSLDPCSNADEEGTTSGGTSGDDIWGTPTSGGPDDESFAGSPPPSNNGTTNGSGCPTYEDDQEQAESEGESEECTGLPELSMEHLLGGSIPVGSSCGMGPLRSFLGRRRLEPLPEEEDCISVGSGVAESQRQVGWW